MESFVDLLGLDIMTIGILIPIVIAVTNFFKTKLKLVGNQNLLVAGIASVMLSVLAFQPDIWAVLSGGVAVFLLSSGIWESGKALAHKAAESKK